MGQVDSSSQTILEVTHISLLRMTIWLDLTARAAGKINPACAQEGSGSPSTVPVTVLSDGCHDTDELFKTPQSHQIEKTMWVSF